MSTPSIYVLDTSVFTTAARFYYAFDILPEFWGHLMEEASKGRIISIDRVYDELVRYKDRLAQWAKREFRTYFASTRDDPTVLVAYRDVVAWVSHQDQYKEAAKTEFARADNADAWVIAYARAKACSLVTQEKFNPDKRNKVPIPNVCRALGITCLDTFELLRQLGIKMGSSQA
ncbi:MAG: DUF4411 family protein [Moorellales bacterium]